MNFRALGIGAMGSGAGFFLAAGITFTANVALANLLDPDGYAAIVLMISWAAIAAQFAQLGFLRASTKIVSIARADGDPGTVKAFLIFAFTALAVSGALGGLVLFGAIRALSPAETAFWALAGATGLLIWPLAICRTAAGVMLGEARGLAGAFFQSGLPHLGILLGAGAVFAWQFMAGAEGADPGRIDPGQIDPATAAAAILAGAYGAALVGIAASARVAGDVWAVPRGAFRAKPWMMLALPLMLAGMVQFLNRQVGTVIIGAIGDTASLAAYFPALKISEFTTFGLIAVNAVVAARLAAAYGQRDTALLQAILSKAAVLALASTLVLAGATLVLGDVLLGLFGDATKGGTGGADTTLTILLVGQVANALTGSAGVLMIMAGQERFAAITAIVILALNVALHFVLVPRFGIEGAAISTAISSVAWNLMLFWRAVRGLGVNPTIFSAHVVRLLRRRAGG